MADNDGRDGMSVTLKQDGKDGTWIVFHGAPARIREQIIETFGIESNNDSLADLVNEATRVYKATGNVSSQLGGRVISDRTSESASQSSGSAWDRDRDKSMPYGGGKSDEPQVDPNVARLTAEIEAAESRDSLKELYARNKAAFDANSELMDAYKAKGKSLPA